MDLYQCVDIAFDAVPVEVRSQFLDDPITAIEQGLNLAVRAADHLSDLRADGGACDGMSFLKDGVILYAPSPRSRRENFTLAHEVGHWAVEQSPDAVYDWLVDEDHPEKVLETVCDRVGARLLVPNNAVSAIVGLGPVRALHVPGLYAATSASRPACAISLAGHLAGLGAVVIIDRQTGEVTHASVRPDPSRGWPRVYPWRGQALSNTHPLMQLDAGESRTRSMVWEMPWGTSEHFYADVTVDDRWIFAVLSATDLWAAEDFHPADAREYDARPAVSGFCCGEQFSRRGYPCTDCGRPFCPKCQLCKCDKDAQREVMCSGDCFMKYMPHLLFDGMCENCR